MSKLADKELEKWQHECTNSKGKTIQRQIIDSLFCGICGWEHEE